VWVNVGVITPLIFICNIGHELVSYAKTGFDPVAPMSENGAWSMLLT
jgi:hypothetical protein